MLLDGKRYEMGCFTAGPLHEHVTNNIQRRTNIVRRGDEEVQIRFDVSWSVRVRVMDDGVHKANIIYVVGIESHLGIYPTLTLLYLSVFKELLCPVLFLQTI